MVPTTLCLISFLTLTVWRFVFTGLWRERLVREIDAPRQQHNDLLEQGLHILDPACVALVAGCLGNGSDGLDPVDQKDRARTYLRRIVALTGATQMGSGYALDVGKTQFYVRDGSVRRLLDATDPKCTYEETCFYSAHKDMPKAEQIATALLQLKNNPALFGKWAVQSGAFKADGELFNSCRTN